MVVLVVVVVHLVVASSVVPTADGSLVTFVVNNQ
jgi:hypothetical protein